MFYLLILVDFMLFIYIYVGSQWVGWSLEQTLGSKAGSALMLLSVFIMVKKGLSIRPLKLGRGIILVGLALLLAGFTLSLNLRNSSTSILVEGEQLSLGGQSVSLQKVTAQDTPGLIRNDVFADVLFDRQKGVESERASIQIMPTKHVDGAYWRIVRFGYAPIISWYSNGKLIGDENILVIATENWSNENEVALTEAGLMRNPPPRMMLGVGTFPPEMEAFLDMDLMEGDQEAPTPAPASSVNYGSVQSRVNEYSNSKKNRKIFLRLSKANVNGRMVSLEGDDYWRYLTQGPLKKPVLTISSIDGDKHVKTTDIRLGEIFTWANSELKFDKLNYWVELERRVDPMVPVIIIGLLTTYLGAAVTAIQFLFKVKRNVFKNRI